MEFKTPSAALASTDETGEPDPGFGLARNFG
jgi:hypothetical protein